MKRNIILWQLIGFGVIVVGGVLLHFLYDWSGEAIWMAPFSSVNESTWEHMKILFFPMLIFAIIQSFFFKEYKKFWDIKLKGIIIGILLIPLLFYFYNGVIGKSPDWINIAIFVISIAVSIFYEIKQFKKKEVQNDKSIQSLFILIMIAALFIVFTFAPLELEIFKDPTTGLYGINNFIVLNI